MNVNSLELKCSAQRALLYNITPSMRCVFFDITNKEDLKLCAYFDKEPTELELELLDSAALEICGDFSGLNDIEVECTVDNKKFNQIESEVLFLYARYEDNN